VIEWSIGVSIGVSFGYRGSSSDFYGPKKGLGSSNWGSSSGSGWDNKSSWADTKPSWDKSDSSGLSSWDSKPSWDKAESKSSWDRDTSDRFDSKQSSSFAENISSSGKNYDDAKFVVFCFCFRSVCRQKNLRKKLF
jgi:hypothetical protein